MNSTSWRWKPIKIQDKINLQRSTDLTVDDEWKSARPKLVSKWFWQLPLRSAVSLQYGTDHSISVQILKESPRKWTSFSARVNVRQEIATLEIQQWGLHKRFTEGKKRKRNETLFASEKTYYSSRVEFFVMTFASFWKALPIYEIMGLIGMPALWVWKKTSEQKIINGNG